MRILDSLPKPQSSSGVSSSKAKGRTSAAGAFYELAVDEAGKLLTAVAPVLGAVTIADAVGLIYVADLADILDAQMLINSGRAAAAALAQDDGLISLQILLTDGSDLIISLFRGA